MALCRNRLSEERKLWRKDHPYVRIPVPVSHQILFHPYPYAFSC